MIFSSCLKYDMKITAKNWAHTLFLADPFAPSLRSTGLNGLINPAWSSPVSEKIVHIYEQMTAFNKYTKNQEPRHVHKSTKPV